MSLAKYSWREVGDKTIVVSLIDQYTDDEFKRIVSLSSSYTDLGKKLGYPSMSGKFIKQLKNRVGQLGLSTSHFYRTEMAKKRSDEEIFILNSIVPQVTLRKRYLQNKYSEYKCSICGLEPIWNGKTLTLILDHINGNNHDNRIENLRWVCPNCNQQLPTTGRSNYKIKKRKKYYCEDCGCEISNRSKRCKSCAAKNRSEKVRKTLRELHPEKVQREELKEMIRNMSFADIGKLYNVNGNTIKKWCKRANLPSRKKDIKKFTDEEWLEL